MYEASQNTFASQVQADLINSNQEKYLRKTLTGQYVPNCLVVNADIRKLRKYAVVKSAIPNLIKQFDEGYAVLRNKTDDQRSSATSSVASPTILSRYANFKLLSRFVSLEIGLCSQLMNT